MANVLVTGGYGCIGSETAKWLLRNSKAAVVVGSRRVSSERSERVFHDVDRSADQILSGDFNAVGGKVVPDDGGGRERARLQLKKRLVHVLSFLDQRLASP